MTRIQWFFNLLIIPFVLIALGLFLAWNLIIDICKGVYCRD